MHMTIEGCFLLLFTSQLLTIKYVDTTFRLLHLPSMISFFCALTLLGGYISYSLMVLRSLMRHNRIKSILQNSLDQNKEVILQMDADILANYNFYIFNVRTDNLFTSIYTLMNQVKKLLFAGILVFGIDYTLIQLLIMISI